MSGTSSTNNGKMNDTSTTSSTASVATGIPSPSSSSSSLSNSSRSTNSNNSTNRTTKTSLNSVCSNDHSMEGQYHRSDPSVPVSFTMANYPPISNHYEPFGKFSFSTKMKESLQLTGFEVFAPHNESIVASFCFPINGTFQYMANIELWMQQQLNHYMTPIWLLLSAIFVAEHV
ncbi:hypothetical protein BLOT_006165 [Blomia tropicalis]|nr:hypothetical protein BLOT_006165 [Blomia tropicalis]